MTDHPNVMPVASAQGKYTVELFPSITAALEAARSIDDSFYLVDRNLLSLYRDELGNLVDDHRCLACDASEDEKTFDGVAKVVNWLQRSNCSKKSTVVAIGGGIIQDLATFSSHVYYRGIRWVFVPTTLLSMSDSCIGAKCGINLNEFKNQLGVFHSPSAVFIATAFTRTLSDLDVASGYGEILKLMLTGSASGLEKLERIIDAEGLRTDRLPELIRDSLEVKKSIIEKDEYESDLRRVLNYGHTFGHALEALTAHEVPHGLAVAWGIDLVNYIAMSRGTLPRLVFEDIHAFIKRHLSFKLSRKPSSAELISATRHDKKASRGAVSLILLERPGALRIEQVPFDRELEREVLEYVELHDAFRGD